MSIMTRVTQAVGRKRLVVSKNSPHILFVGGATGIVVSTVLACRATLKLEKTLENIQEDINGARGDVIEDERPESAVRRDVAYSYAKGSLELVKLYGPAIAVGGVSMIALTGSHVQMTRRNTALTVAYTGLHQAYMEYRGRVRDELGEERERDLYHGVCLAEVEDENGKKKTVKQVDPNGLSPYARFFDEASSEWTKDPEINRLFVQCQQNYFNQLLQARGHVFLNEVYDALGIDRSSAGSVVGWVIGEEGDNYVSFGLFKDENARFVNGWERSILLDFNVDGVIYDKI